MRAIGHEEGDCDGLPGLRQNFHLANFALGVARYDGCGLQFVEQRLRSLSVFGFLTALILFNLAFYLPPRLEKMFGLYGVQHAHLEPFLTPAAEKLAPAIFVVHPQSKWIEYGTLLELESPFLDSPFIFIYSRGAAMDQYVVSHFPDRAVYHYYPDQPHTFYQYPRP